MRTSKVQDAVREIQDSLFLVERLDADDHIEVEMWSHVEGTSKWFTTYAEFKVDNTSSLETGVVAGHLPLLLKGLDDVMIHEERRVYKVVVRSRIDESPYLFRPELESPQSE